MMIRNNAIRQLGPGEDLHQALRQQSLGGQRHQQISPSRAAIGLPKPVSPFRMLVDPPFGFQNTLIDRFPV